MPPSRVSTRSRRRTSTTTAATTNTEENDNKSNVQKTKETKKSKGANKKTLKETKNKEDDTILSSSESGSSVDGKKKRKKAATKTKEAKESKPKKAKIEPQRLTEKDELTKLWDAEKALNEKGSYTFKILSWNVAGLRAILRNHPDALPNLAKKYDLDVICLQETKLQDIHVDDPKLKIKGFLLEEEGYDSYYNCATSKKGYSGTAVFVKRRNKNKLHDDTTNNKKQTTMAQFFNKTTAKNKDQDPLTENETDEEKFDTSILIPTDVTYKIGKSKHDTEGRMITLHYPNLFTLSNLYVPNSGQKLDRLSYRTQEWDQDLVEYMDQYAKKSQNPVIWLGDLNVAHKALDTWNEGAKHLAKSAGTTKEERDSFEKQLCYGDTYVDAFRHLHPAKGAHYTYWSQRAGNRAPNKGLRLDYFICSQSLMQDDGRVVVRDSYMIPEQMGSDHCPIVLEIEIKASQT